MLANSSLFKLSQIENLKPEDIRIDGGTQSRAGLNLETVAEYAEAMLEGAKFPPVVAFFDGNCFWLVDGFHRLAAVRQAGLPYIEVQIGSFGTQRDAILHSVGVNNDHGLRRTNADKRHAVLKLLQDADWVQWSDNEIARACRVSQPFVSKLRSEIFPAYNRYKSARKGRDGRILNVVNIGKSSVKSEVDNQAKDLGLATSRVQVLPSMDRNHTSPDDVDDRPFSVPVTNVYLETCESTKLTPQDPEPQTEQMKSDFDRLAPLMSKSSPEHYTPKHILDAVVKCIGEIELDPCSNSKDTPNVQSQMHFTQEENGLSQDWKAQTLFMNPPYGRGIEDWIEKLVYSHESGMVEKAIALVPARTDTQWFKKLRDYPVCFVEGRLTFIGNDKPAPFPSALFYLGSDFDKFYHTFQPLGDIWQRVVKPRVELN